MIENDWKHDEEVLSEDDVENLNEIYRPSLTKFCSPPGAFLRDIIVKHIEQNGYHRPSYNRIRNEEHELVNYQVYETLHLMQTLIINLMPMQ
jgi:hypothetical protein